ncbi:MAG: HD domain-containing protein [Lachnospiraceae bacterium]|nr:HD domain-containing protein [Lachnospiraceae bacterium]
MKYIQDFKEGDRVAGVYLCKHKTSAVTKNGKPYENVVLQDKTGSIDAKIWDVGSQGIDEFEALDYIDIMGDVSSFMNQLQVSIKRVRVASEGEYIPSDYLPVSSKNVDEMFNEILGMVNATENRYLKALLEEFFVKDEKFVKAFKYSSAAKSVHHCFVGGLLEHTLSVAKNCKFFAMQYPYLKKDLLIAAALLHDCAKVVEFSPFPENDYTDEGNLLGHIVMGSEMIGQKVALIDGFPKTLENELKHCILSHHGKLEYGSPKKPMLMEAVALNFADDIDAKMETFKEILDSTTETGWLGYNKLFETNLRSTKATE